MTLPAAIQATVHRYPDRPAVSDGERTLTYRGLWAEAERYADRLKCDVRGAFNLIEATPSVDFVVAVIGTYLAGRVLVPVARNAPADRVRRLEEDLRSSCPPDVAEILQTTGTTGTSKQVMVSSRAAWAAADNNRHFDRITEDTVYLIASPLNHVSALRKLEACLLVGAHAVLTDGFIDIKRYYERIERYQVNSLLLPPAAVMLLLTVTRDPFSALAARIRLVHSNGAPMTEALKESLRRCLPHARLVFAYGSTEAGSACCAYDYAEFPGKEHCVGKAGPRCRVSVEDGCLVVSGETVMEGYLNDAALTADVLRDGGVRTCDLGRVDEDGFIYVLGRKDDIINCGGLKVAPVDVEDAVMRYPGIVDCVCFGLSDSLSGQAVALEVVPDRAATFDLVAFRRFLQSQLERHQVPTRIRVVSAIPHTANGKIDRTRMVNGQWSVVNGQWSVVSGQ